MHQSRLKIKEFLNIKPTRPKTLVELGHEAPDFTAQHLGRNSTSHSGGRVGSGPLVQCSVKDITLLDVPGDFLISNQTVYSSNLRVRIIVLKFFILSKNR